MANLRHYFFFWSLRTWNSHLPLHRCFTRIHSLTLLPCAYVALLLFSPSVQFSGEDSQQRHGLFPPSCCTLLDREKSKRTGAQQQTRLPPRAAAEVSALTVQNINTKLNTHTDSSRRDLSARPGNSAKLPRTPRSQHAGPSPLYPS